jgi:hypothetical protein
MTDEFTPPIKERTTEELLKVVGAPEKWNPNAVRLASNELTNRKVEPKKIETAKYLSKKRDKIQQKIKANESYHVCDFILNPFWTWVAAVTTASVGTAVYVAETRPEKTETVQVVAPPAAKPMAVPTAITAPIASAAPVVEPEEEEPAPVVVVKPAIAKPAPMGAEAASAKPVDTLRQELGLVEDARRALAAGDPSIALRHVDDHARRFPSGAFAVERDVIRIDALAAAGRRDEAASRARDFLARHPGSAQARRIATMTEQNP